MKKLIFALPILLGVLGISSKSIAHTMFTNYLLNDQLEFQTTYSTDEAAKNAEVYVYAPNNFDEPWLESRTDEEGRFSDLIDMEDREKKNKRTGMITSVAIHSLLITAGVAGLWFAVLRKS